MGCLISQDPPAATPTKEQLLAQTRKKAVQANNHARALSNTLPCDKQVADRIYKQTELHNLRRADHGLAPLVLNLQICGIALQYAKKLNESHMFQFSNNSYKGQTLGQNLGFITKPSRLASELWYNQGKQYSYEVPSLDRAAHFTQMMWRESREVGFGIKGNYIVANYLPCGNNPKKMKENVPKPLI